jgi:hypothetical protein
MFKLTGTVKVVKDTIQVTDSFKKREFVITDTDPSYPQEIAFQAAQDKCSILDGFAVGQQVEVSFNLRGREWTSPQGEVKYFNTLDAWKLESVGESVTPAPLQSAPSDDLPF